MRNDPFLSVEILHNVDESFFAFVGHRIETRIWNLPQNIFFISIALAAVDSRIFCTE